MRTGLQHPLTQLVDLLKLGQNPLVLLSLHKLATLGGGQKLAWLGAGTDDHQGGKEKGDVDLVHFSAAHNLIQHKVFRQNILHGITQVRDVGALCKYQMVPSSFGVRASESRHAWEAT